MFDFRLIEKLKDINKLLREILCDNNEECLNRSKKDILTAIEKGNRTIERRSSRIFYHNFKFDSQSKIIRYHDNLINIIKVIFEREISTNIQNKEKIEELNFERSQILDEIQKVRDENLKEENIGYNFKFCHIYEKLSNKTVNLIIANSDNEYVTCIQNSSILRESEDKMKLSLLKKLAYNKLIIDLTKPEENLIDILEIEITDNEIDIDFIVQYIISPCLFNVFIDDLIDEVISKNLGAL
ncbi:unnamed protein product, partial [Brachionus calyciflorus]